jgi:hypothetical protein
MKLAVDMRGVIFANYLDAAVCAALMAIMVATIVSGVIGIHRALATPPLAVESTGAGVPRVVGPSEAEPFWTKFLRSLTSRGLRGVKLVISDAHEGLKRRSDRR